MILSSLMSRSGDGIEVQAEPNVQEKFEYMEVAVHEENLQHVLLIHIQGWILCVHHYNCDQKHTDGNIEAAEEATDETDSIINTKERLRAMIIRSSWFNNKF